VKRILVSLALIERQQRWFLQRRDPGANVLPGRWEFPGGKAEAGENPRQTLLRELREELDWEPENITELAKEGRIDGDTELVFHLFYCSGPGPLSTSLAWGWFLESEIPKLPIPPLNLILLPYLAKVKEPRRPASMEL